MVNNIDALIVQITSDKDYTKARALLDERASIAKDYYDEFKPSKIIASGGICYTTPDRDEIDAQSILLSRLMNSKGIPDVELQTASGDTWTNIVFTYFDHIKDMNLEKPSIGIIGFHRYEALSNLILGNHANINLLNNEKMSFLKDDLLTLVLDVSFKFYGAKDRNPESHLRAINKYHPEIGTNPMKIAPYYSALKGMKALKNLK